jgi:hypothetical protein
MDTPPLAFVAEHQTPGQKTGRQSKPNMRRRTTWKPGQSGKPLDGGLLVKRQNEARKARYDELCAAFAGELPNPTPFELALISSAADLLPVRGEPFFCRARRWRGGHNGYQYRLR